MSVRKAIASNIRAFRKRRNLTVKEAAGRLGVATSCWSQWENGKRFPSADLIVSVAEVLAVRPCLLLTADPSDCPRFAIEPCRDKETRGSTRSLRT
jgi:transcriptional regulator with XRE-family HTH domain